MINITVIILTFNQKRPSQKPWNAQKLVSDDIHIVDLFSEDKTLEIAGLFGAKVEQRKLINYSEQRNWAIDNLIVKHPWQLHFYLLILSDDLINRITHLEPVDNLNGYFIPRFTKFLGRPIYHGGMYPIWHMRLFRTGKGRCENRQYDQHFQLAGRTEKLPAPVIDDQRMSLREWTNRHNRWSDLEADEKNVNPLWMVQYKEMSLEIQFEKKEK